MEKEPAVNTIKRLFQSLVGIVASLLGGHVFAHAKMLGKHLLRRLSEDNVPGVAASLSYTSLLALVPLLSISVAVMTAFPVFDGARTDLQRLVFDTFVPTSGEVIEGAITTFVAATGRLTAIGVVGLAVTSVMLLVTIERAFNDIFRASQGRSVVARLVLYWTVLTLGPMLMGTAFALSGYVAAVGGEGSLWAKDTVGEWAYSWAQGAWGLASLALPYLLTTIAFGLIYRLVPNRSVKTWDAVIGALLAGSIFALLRYGFLTFLSHGGAYQTVYGAMAALPLFLLWMYLSWMVVVAGAVVAAALPEWRLMIRRGQQQKAEPLWIALSLLDLLRAAHPKGCMRSQLDLVSVNASEIDRVLMQMSRANLVLCDGDERWVALADFHRVTLAAVAHAIAPQPDPLRIPQEDAAPWARELRDIMVQARQAETETLNMTLQAFFAASLAADPAQR